MIWITTLCLLAIAAWLFFNAMNERRWVEAHSHDETVASDEGLLPSFTAMTRTAQLQGDGKVSIDQENTRFARAVAKVQEKTKKLGDKYIESKAAAARISDSDERPASASEENTVFGRMVAKVGAKAASIDDKLDAKMKAASSQSAMSATGDTTENGGSFFDRATRKVAERSDEITQRVAHRAKNAADSYGSGRRASEEDGLFGRMVNKVSSGLESVEKKVDQRMANSRVASDTRGLEPSDDLVTRVSAKVGTKINEIDEKIVDASKSAVNKYDK